MADAILALAASGILSWAVFSFIHKGVARGLVLLALFVGSASYFVYKVFGFASGPDVVIDDLIRWGLFILFWPLWLVVVIIGAAFRWDMPGRDDVLPTKSE